MSRDVYLPKARSEFFVVILFHDIWLVLNVKRLCVIVDRVISAANVYVNFVLFPYGVDRKNTGFGYVVETLH